MMSQSYHLSGRLRFDTRRCINAIILYPLVPRVGEYNIRKGVGVERIE